MTQQVPFLPDHSFKDATPLHTVERIKNILKQYDIHTTEKWNSIQVPNCHSLRVAIPGTTFGTNGKGVTRELALASAYGEFMERLQLGYIGSTAQQKETITGQETTTQRADWRQLLQQNKDWYESLARQFTLFTGTDMTPEAILRQYEDESGTVKVIPYYNISKKQWEQLPITLCNAIYTTNGCAAGNSIEEAIVQALSEIVERSFMLKILAEKIALPEIPDEALQRCPMAWDTITYLRNNGFRITVFDCSLGTKFPVVCVALINEKNGRYHTHFGAFPNFEITLQRALTESFQNRTPEDICQHDSFARDDMDIFALDNLMNELVKGTANRRPGFFVARSDKPYNASVGFTGKNNREILLECIDFFQEQGFDILVRDRSCLGFPTCQVIVPGCSEVFPHRVSTKYNDLRYGPYAAKVLRDPSAAKIDDLMAFLMHLSELNKKNLAGRMNFLSMSMLPAELTDTENAFYFYASLAHINYTLGRTAEVIKYLDKLIATHPEGLEEYLICVKRYLSLQNEKRAPDEIRKILDHFHQEQTAEQIFSLITEGRNPFDAIVLHCDQTCSPHCKLIEKCRFRYTSELMGIIKSKTLSLDRTLLPRQLSEIF